MRVFGENPQGAITTTAIIADIVWFGEQAQLDRLADLEAASGPAGSALQLAKADTQIQMIGVWEVAASATARNSK